MLQKSFQMVRITLKEFVNSLYDSHHCRIPAYEEQRHALVISVKTEINIHSSTVRVEVILKAVIMFLPLSSHDIKILLPDNRKHGLWRRVLLGERSVFHFFNWQQSIFCNSHGLTADVYVFYNDTDVFL